MGASAEYQDVWHGWSSSSKYEAASSYFWSSAITTSEVDAPLIVRRMSTASSLPHKSVHVSLGWLSCQQTW